MRRLHKACLLIFTLLVQGQGFATTVVAEPTPVAVIPLGQASSTTATAVVEDKPVSSSMVSQSVSSSSSSQDASRSTESSKTTVVETVTSSTATDTESVTTQVKAESKEESKSETTTTIKPVKAEEDNQEGKASSAQTIIPVETMEEGSAFKSPSADMGKILAQKEKLENILKEYEALADKSGKVPQWTCLNHSFRVDDDDPALITVKKQLHLLGFFAASQKGSDLQFTSTFSKQLENAVKKFQKRHFLEPDGVIGRRTCIALNMTPQERIKKIKLNLARWKELEESLKGKYVLVNIPTYRLYAMDDRRIDLTQPVIVGMKTRETPIFTSNMNSVVLNPAWGVPVSIFIKDKLNKVLQDPHYLSKSGFTVMDEDGDLITDSSVDWSHVSLSNFPYTIRQLPGKNNALGSIKFNLDNKEAIYLHGTPQKNLFHRIARPFSSGCVRLKFPQKLATWALKGTQYDKLEKLQEKIQTGHTSAILLKQPIPVHFTYITVWVDNKKRVLFSDDPYNLDKKDYERFNL